MLISLQPTRLARSAWLPNGTPPKRRSSTTSVWGSKIVDACLSRTGDTGKGAYRGRMAHGVGKGDWLDQALWSIKSGEACVCSDGYLLGREFDSPRVHHVAFHWDSVDTTSNEVIENRANKETLIPFSFVIKLPAPRYERVIISRDGQGKILHSVPSN